MRDDPFYIPDKNEKYSAIFRDHVPLLLLSETQRSRMQPLLDSEAVKPYMWYLEHSIQLESTPNGPRMHEADVTKKYAERMQYIRRLVFHRHKTPPPPEVSTALAKLQGFHVYTVDSVNTTYHLDGIHITTTGNLAVDQSAAQFAIFVNRDCTPARRDLLICLQLAELLEVDMEGISSIMAQDPEILLEYVEAIGLPHIPSTVLDEDHAHMQDRLLEYPGLPESPATINSPQPKRPNNGGAISAEYFAYNVLKFLPQFGPKNWTSELRGEVKEFDGYQGKAVADFVYEDSEGALTNMLYGAERKQAWRNQWPTYHLKVKATPGQMGQQYVFEMSRDDIEAASRHSTYRSVGTVPREVYVIIRVYDAEGTAPSYRIYPDPLLLLRKGELRIVSDVGILPMEDDCAPRK
ncbi:hypothetical protein BOTBODRAFT_340753 [Botryobasidium botryosum FD-172 SS1]|uniref:Protein NO VEIN C-terminal domain-containing protein n=1 Tax=Botryobasidium botryosum (strain FD-172 SS1) TaxID=930990 RepID=A0A067MGY1_BOTB1|nr:hypothetical protein BOTBODRAFT_340753 [Botryobasidium botryosum FD-172 SS1]